jgi:hypothetical protein
MEALPKAEEKLEAKLEHVMPPAAADTTTAVGILEGKPTSMEALPEAEKELEAMSNVHALFFNGTFITSSDSSSRLPTWTRTCPSTRPFDPGKSYPFDPGIDNSSRSLLDLASSLKPSDPIDTTGWSPWTSFNVSNIAEFANSSSNSNDVVDNAACFDYKYSNAWRLPPWPDDDELSAKAEPLFPPPKAEAWFLPPWPDDDELSAKAEPLDERRPEPRHQLNDGQHHSDKPCNTNCDGYTLPSAKPC